ncbi:MAG: hypothetical protein ACR2JJ_09050 [Sphingomicrobium sp.]
MPSEGAIEDWERAFRAKSERRRRRAERESLIRRFALLALLAVMIGLAIWATDVFVTEYVVLG